MLEERCRGHGIFRVHNCGGRGWNWEGRRAATCTCLAAAPRSHADARATVSLECARLLQPSPDHPVELFQIIGQDSYEGAVRKSNGMVLNKLLHPPRSLIVTPREACVAQAESSGTDIVVPPQHNSRIFVLDGYRDEIVLKPCCIPPQRLFLNPLTRCCPPRTSAKYWLRCCHCHSTARFSLNTSNVSHL